MEKRKRQSHAPRVALNQRIYEAKKRQLEALGLPPREREQRLRALAQNLGL